MSSRHHIDDFMRGRIIGKIEEGRKITDVARSSTSLTALFHGCGSHLKLLECSRRHGEVVLEVRRLQKTDISSYQQKGTGAPQLSRQHRTARLQWCREHHNWTEQDWACVLFSDESRFSLLSDCRRQLIWRESGTAYRPENIQEKDRYPTLAVQDCLDSKGIQRLVWPARSPDLNPIENVWDSLGRQVAGRNYPPTNKNTLIRALTEEWDKLLQQLLDNVVQSMVRRVECCITLHGGHIPY
ncbi:transposable element Tcb1 transposase [Trichonephila clavipes]|nr:transposable element Tcb1 transposase [Trichonephila clavipes]